MKKGLIYCIFECHGIAKKIGKNTYVCNSCNSHFSVELPLNTKEEK